MKALGKRLKQRREDLRLDQEDVADKACVSRAYVSRLERGLVPAPKLTELTQVVEALQWSLVEALRQPPGTRTERYSVECSDLAAQLEGETPHVAEAVLRAWRMTLDIAKARQNEQNN